MRKNILYITDTGTIRGGGEISLLNLLENLDPGSFRATVCVPSDGEWAGRIKALGIPVRLFGYKKVMNPLNLAATISAIASLRDTIEQEHIDLVHTNATGGIVFLAGIACWLARKPLVSHIRLIETGFLQDLIQGILSTKIVIISRRVGEKAGFALFRDKVRLIYNGVDLERFSCREPGTSLRKELGFPDNAVVIGTAGAYIPDKGFDYLIKAAALLKQEIPGLRVIIVGSRSGANESYAAMLRDMARDAGVEGMISFLDSTDDMGRVYNALDVFVLASPAEPFGRVLIEAMACEKPVVAFRSGAVPEIVIDGVTGILVQPRDEKGLAQAVGSLLKDKETAMRLGKNGRQRCASLFDIKTHARSVQDLYGEILQDPSRGFVPCPVCGISDDRMINSCAVIEQDAKIAEKTLYLCRCRKCGLVYVNPQPRIIEEDPGHLYDKEYLDDYMKYHSVAHDGTLQLNEPFSVRLSMITRVKNTGALLDIGCATGEFLKACSDAGFSVTGVDISPYACETARSKYGFDIRQGSFETIRLPDRSFDVISCADVLEHTRDPRAFLREVRRILKDDGVLYLAVPDFGSVHYQFMSMVCRFTHKNYFVLPHHLYHFTRRTLERLFAASGFSIVSRMASESQIREAGLKRFVMRMLFFLGRMLGAKDRLVVIAAKSEGQR